MYVIFYKNIVFFFTFLFEAMVWMWHVLPPKSTGRPIRRRNEVSGRTKNMTYVCSGLRENPIGSVSGLNGVAQNHVKT